MSNKGIWYGVAAYATWGVLPIYWKTIAAVPALEILNHRVVWSLLFLATVLTFRHEWPRLRRLWRTERRQLLLYTTTALLLSVNWGTYIWAVNAGFIVEASLGYFINPLVNVLLGMVFLGERLRRWQMVAVLIALAGVVYLTVRYGRLPWIALTLALSFGFYGLLRKKGVLTSVQGLTLETGILFFPALGYLLWLHGTDTAVFLHAPRTTNLLLPLAGFATAFPLLWFGIAAKHVTLTTLGILQYLAPTGQFLIGVFVYHEPFTRNQLLGYALIWCALIIYTIERTYHQCQSRATPTPVA